MSRKKVLVLGGNFAGLTAALSVHHELDGDVDVKVVSMDDQFLFTPSLIWVPFGKRAPEDIRFPLAPTFESNGVDFVHAAATRIDLASQKVETTAGVEDYDHLVIATGYRNDFDAVPGTTPGGRVHAISTLEDALHTGEAWQRFLDDPGDIVVGATPGAGCFGAAYEYLFNMAYHLRRNGLQRQVKLTWVTAEPFLGHFGIGGLKHGEGLLEMFMRKEHIDVRTNAAIEEIDDGQLRLADGERLDFEFAMVMPPFVGQEVVRDATEIADAKGYVRVRDTYQAEGYDNVYAVGVAAAVDAPWQTPVPVGVPKTGFPSETQAHVAARNIAAQIRGERPTEEKAFGDIPAVCVMDAGNNGVIILADHMLPPRKHSVLVPGPQAHGMKVAFEKYFLWKARHGYVRLP